MSEADHEARSMAQRALDRIDGHEEICAERYTGINDKLSELKSWFVGSVVALIVVMGSGIATLASIVWNAK